MLLAEELAVTLEALAAPRDALPVPDALAATKTLGGDEDAAREALDAPPRVERHVLSALVPSRPWLQP
jgi:hypothetical protein